jgi:hypothetical protein
VIALSREFTRDEFRALRERAIFDCGKLDPHAFDAPTIAPFALRLAPSAWNGLAALAERCAAELERARAALAAESAHWRALGISRRMRAVLGARRAPDARDPRFMRFDFHPTEEGWRASEVNADVPGGFIEAGALTRAVAERLPALACPPDPAALLAESVAARLASCGRGGDVALVHATSYTDDQQVMRRIGAELARLGVSSHFAAPDHVAPAADGGCALSTNGARIGAVVRFFPAEWLENLPRAARLRWREIDARVPQANPLSALLVQSKRLPLVLSRLGLPTPVWSSVLPQVRAIGLRRFARSIAPAGLVLKPSWGRVGEGVAMEGVTEHRAARRAEWSARVAPRHWLLQRRFESKAIGEQRVHACLGVYVIDGRAAGVYARVAERPLIDGRAQDAAVLLDPSLDPSLDATGDSTGDPPRTQRAASLSKELHHARH